LRSGSFPVPFFLRRIFILFTAFSKLPFRHSLESSPKLHMQTTKGCVICSVAEIPGRVEWFFHT
jgi:hypothetical protein